MQLDAIEGWLFDGSEATIGAWRDFRGSEFPMVFAAVKIKVCAGLHKIVEAAGRFLQLVAIDPEFRRQLRQSSPARDTVFGTSLPIGWLAKEYFFRYCASKMR